MRNVDGGAGMKLQLEKKMVPVLAGQSLLDLIRQAELDSSQLSVRPIAAKIGKGVCQNIRSRSVSAAVASYLL